MRIGIHVLVALVSLQAQKVHCSAADVISLHVKCGFTLALRKCTIYLGHSESKCLFLVPV